MKLLFCDDKKIDAFILPKEVKDYYSINYYYSKDSIREFLFNHYLTIITMAFSIQVISL